MVSNRPRLNRSGVPTAQSESENYRDELSLARSVCIQSGSISRIWLPIKTSEHRPTP
jgi:hypothetical protein